MPPLLLTRSELELQQLETTMKKPYEVYQISFDTKGDEELAEELECEWSIGDWIFDEEDFNEDPKALAKDIAKQISAKTGYKVTKLEFIAA